MNSVKFMNDFEVKGLKEMSKTEMKEVSGGWGPICLAGAAIVGAVSILAWTTARIGEAFNGGGPSGFTEGADDVATWGGRVFAALMAGAALERIF